MKPTSNTQKCARGEEIVAYLYGEASPAEAQDFSRHLEQCAACQEELADFSQVRDAVAAWRAEILNVTPSLALGEASAPTGRPAPAPKRSALSALREFFTLSPLWLQVGSIAAALVVCALATLAVVNAEISTEGGKIAFRTGLVPQRVVTREVKVPVAQPFPQDQFNRMVEERVAREVQARLDERKPEVQIERVLVPVRVNPAPSASTPKPQFARQKENGSVVLPPRPRTQLAVERDNPDEGMPRLSDLFGEVDN